MIAAATDRRSFLRGGALLGGALLLPGCVTTGRAPLAAASCLPPVKVSPERVIRTVAGLRPYRASGFVVRRDPFGEQALVHNYGHGGAGITLSWGTSALAAQLGLQGHQGPVAVIGAGVMGLTTARLVQEAGFPVTIYAAALPPETTSNVSGGQISPFGHYRDSAVTPEWRNQFYAAMDYSWRRFETMVGDRYGIRWLPTYVEGDGGPDPSNPLERYHPNGRNLTPADHPFPVDQLASYDTMYVEVPRYLRQLLGEIESAGGRVIQRSFASPADLAQLPEKLLFNCTGLGSHHLFGDTELRPVRGQLAILQPQPEVRYAFTGAAGYMFSRPDGILLGGTFEYDEWRAEPEPERIAGILASHRELFEGFRCTA